MPDLHTTVGILTAIAFGAVLLLFVHIVNNTSNTLEWYHLISSRGPDGKQYADWNKIGQGTGCILSVWVTVVYTYSPKMDWTGLLAVLTPVLLYLGGVSSYAANLRSKQGSVETTTVTEKPPATTVTETKTEIPPVK